MTRHRTVLAASIIGLTALVGCSSSSAGTELPDTEATGTVGGAAVPAPVGPSAPTPDSAAPPPVARTDVSNCAMSDPIDQVIEIDSTVFGTTDRVSVHFTPCAVDQPTPNPIVYLLHGAGADETQWPDVNIFLAADAAVVNGTMPPSILVAPDAADAYSCVECADDLLTHLIDEIEPTIERSAPIDPLHRAIGGISRGGGLALQVAGLAPDQFVAVGAHSSVNVAESALTSIAEARLPVRFDVGDDDGLAGASDDMWTYLDAHGGQAELVVSAGGHDRAYWRSQADTYTAFYATHLW